METLELRTVLSRCAHEVSVKLTNSLSYSDVSCFDILREMPLNCSILSEELIEEWLVEVLELWVHERAPIPVYARFLLAASIEIQLKRTVISEKSLLLMLKAMNYYGHYYLVVELAEKRLTQSDYFYSISKHIGKAYKCLGYYKESLQIYRCALDRARIDKNELQIALFLVLVGKLFDDYHQKKGIHEFFHTVAYNRVKGLSLSSDKPDNRIIELCMECYAKALPEGNDERCSIYEHLLQIHNKRSEYRYRIQLNRDIGAIRHRIDCLTLIDVVTTRNILDGIFEVDTIVQWIKSDYENIRVYAIRCVQEYSLIRQLFEKITKLRNSECMSEFTSRISIPTILYKLRVCADYCARYNEKKYYTFSALEMARWMIIDTYQSGKDTFYYPTQTHLDQLAKAKRSLESGEQRLPLISDTYIDVLSEIASLNTKDLKFSVALSAYKEIYDHFSILLEDIKTDTKRISAYSKTDCITKEAEFAVLSDKEISKLTTVIYFDYESITAKMLNTGQSIIALQDKEVINLFDETMTIPMSIDYHSLNGLINRTINAFEISTDETVIVKRNLEEIKSRVESIRRSIDTLKGIGRVAENFLAVKTATEYLDRLKLIPQYQSIKGDFCIRQMDSDFHIYFTKRIFVAIIEIIFSNAVELSERLGREKYRVDFTFLTEGDDDIRTVCLQITDDLGEYEAFSKIVDNINSLAFDKVHHDNYRGKGLSFIKKATLTHQNWRLEYHEMDGTKSLKIPLCYQVSKDRNSFTTM